MQNKTQRAAAFLVSVIILAGAGCKNKEEGPVVSPFTAKATVTMQHVFGAAPLVLSSQWYVNANNDSLRFAMVKYYISNIKLLSGGQSFAIPGSYFLIDESQEASKTFTLSGLPSAAFDGIEFLIGVDSAKNAGGAQGQTGALDAIHNMYWGWASGYVFTKIEGYFMDGSESGFSLHVGGFESPNNAIRKVTLSFGAQSLQATNTGSDTLVIKTDWSEYFKNPVTLDLKQINSVHAPSAVANSLADNYADMFSFGEIK
ncbi:MAG: hypothetical protein K1X81_04970 [Bacteroidia bacterium]|nr:hypothetical protein [Bacteroidia bacterium]